MTPDLKKVYGDKYEPFIGHARAYFRWSYHGDARIWDEIEAPALEDALTLTTIILNYKKRKRVTNIFVAGSGAGKDILFLRNFGFKEKEIEAADANSLLVKLSSELFPKVKVVKRDVLDPNIRNEINGKHIVISNLVLNHFSNSQSQLAISNFYNILTKDGIFIGTVPFNKPTGIQNETPDGNYTISGAPWGGMIKHWHRTEEEYIKQFKYAGLTDMTLFHRGFRDFPNPHYIEAIEELYPESTQYPNRTLIIAEKQKNTLPDIEGAREELIKGSYNNPLLTRKRFGMTFRENL